MKHSHMLRVTQPTIKQLSMHISIAFFRINILQKLYIFYDKEERGKMNECMMQARIIFVRDACYVATTLWFDS